jgi:ATP-dependent helicase HrpA
VDAGDHVVVQQLDSLPNAQRAHHAGVRRLLMLVEGRTLRNLQRNIRNLAQMKLHYANAPDAVTPRRPGERDSDLVDDILMLAFDAAFLEDAWSIRDCESFARCRDAGRPRLGPALLAISTQVAEILAHAHQARAALAQLTQPNWRPSVDDMQLQLQGLVYRGFLRDVDLSNLAHYPRYLDALLRRIEKLAGAARRDQQCLQELIGVAKPWRERQRQAAEKGLQDHRLEEIRWMIEELRVSLFAQELGTAQPVSAKRIQRRWEALGL